MDAQPSVRNADPYLKQRILDDLRAVVRGIFAGDRQERLDKIIVDNCNAQGHGEFFLLYRDRLYRHSTIAENARAPRMTPRLHESLRADMAAWHEEEEEMRQEQHVVMGHLTAILNSSNHPEDYMLLMPDCLKPTLQQYAYVNPDARRLTPEQIQLMQEKTYLGLSVLKKRMVLNLLG